MSQKRKHDESPIDDQDAQKFSKKPRADVKAGGPHSKSKGNRRPEQKTYTTTGQLKSRIRDLKRLLEHVDNTPKHKMSATSRIERERELATCEHQLAEKVAAAREVENRQKMIGKYHQVRFFDRQKATRILKRLRKRFSANMPGDTLTKDELLRRIHHAEVDVNYAQYYPLSKTYPSLYPSAKQSKKKAENDTDEDETPNQQADEQVDGPKGDVEIWKAIERAMEEGGLDEIRNSEGHLPALKPKEASRKKQTKKQKVKKKAEVQENTDFPPIREEAEESDGGFFE
ncbi:hypothetical protein K505DRAFT_314276 [Melanomma pulvis-pyrius CBS 109.77]|uniref:rRNA-processing protein EFG1 n=1 Tax=Melanomma pulvis-pyrius CBS 109.77 TaxID=1314802 RepID=A0A6A6WXY2_9PLEO|nr:hypothetical protein K505DRAFT_314276 [Melanomma pulvis-pyrius CBS 109.77]